MSSQVGVKEAKGGAEVVIPGYRPRRKGSRKPAWGRNPTDRRSDQDQGQTVVRLRPSRS